MHRLILAAALSCFTCFACFAVGCGGGEKKDVESPTSNAGGDKPAGASGDKESVASAGDTSGDAGAATPEKKKDVCAGFDIANLEDLLAKSDCEVPDAKPDMVQNPDMKGKLEVSVAASPTKVAPGGKVDLVVSFQNKTKDPMPLTFRIDPVARFETETYDAKKKRADMPAGQPPPPPKGHSAPPPAEAKVARVTVAPSGFARVRVPWEAVKMKWAPEKVRGTAVEKGYPRAPAGPLAKGKYTVKVITPLVGVFEGGDHEVSAPKVDVEVGG